jgi:putative SOS response-associated peptidase YedK
MCLDIAFYSALELIDDYFPGLVHDGEIPFDLDLGAHVLAMGYSRYPVITQDQGAYHRKYFEWCIVAEYMNSPEKIRAMRPKMANARAEKLLDPKAFWYRIRKNRCLIPVTGIYEHREISGWKNKVPYYVQVKDRKMFCIPGLYYYNRNLADPETGELKGMFSLITRDGNPLMRQIHNGGDNAFRMPLFLNQELERKWLDPSLSDEEMARIVQYEIPSEALEYHTVFSIRGRTPRPDGKPKNAFFEFPNLPPLGSGGSGPAPDLFSN